MILPPPDEESSWITRLLEVSEEELVEAARVAVEAGRLRLAGRVVGLLEEETVKAHPELERAAAAGRLQLLEGGIVAEQERLEDEETALRRRRARIQRARRRTRRGSNPKDPRFTRRR